jgi:hypothetical protein
MLIAVTNLIRVESEKSHTRDSPNTDVYLKVLNSLKSSQLARIKLNRINWLSIVLIAELAESGVVFILKAFGISN